MVRIDKEMLDGLFTQAEGSPRRRSHHRFHLSDADPVQRILICAKAGSYIRPHRHPASHLWEFILAVRGRLRVLLFDDTGRVTETLLLEPGGSCNGLEIPSGTWHSVAVLDDEAAFAEVKPGPYEASSYAEFAAWAPAEGEPAAAAAEAWFRAAAVGDRFTL
jgi:cupin fold WbuC family metalloprotein